MFLDKALLLKGVAGVAAVGGGGGLLVCYQKGYFSKEDKAAKAEVVDENTLIGNVGLNCDLNTASESNGVDCSKKDGQDVKINVKQGETKFEVSTLPSDGAKIKLYKLTGDNNGYNKNLKFVIEDGTITDNSHKLEEFETYQIEEVEETPDTSKPQEKTKKYYLSRKDGSGKKIRELLGLPSDCNFPESNSTSSQTCTITSGNVNNIAFDGKTNATIEGNGTLQIAVASSNETEDFPLGFKFTLTPTSGNLTINNSSNEKNITIPSSKATEFKIKRDSQNKKQLTLEKAWTLETLTKKVGIECTDNNNECNLKTSGSLSLKKSESNKGDHNLPSTNSNASGAKIKLYKDTDASGYENELKFVIEGGDITVTSGTTPKLEQFETYEIKKDSDGKWYLTRRDDAGVGMGKALGLPDGCKLPSNSSSTCNEVGLDANKLKSINFEGKNNNDTPTVGNGANLKLTITKESGDALSDFIDGYKFLFKTEQDVTVNATDASKNIVFKQGTDLEFKIKKNSGTNTLTLERTWTSTSLGDKVGLNCTDDSKKECTLEDNKVNVHNGDSNKYTGLSKNNSSDNKKVKYEDGQQGYNQGFRFYADGEEDISLKNGTSVAGGSSGDDNNKKIFKKNGSGSGGEVYYEIKKQNNVWYLVKKANGASA